MNEENKPNNKSFETKSENKTRECCCACACNLPKVGDFQQIIHLKNSGLTIFMHKNIEVQKTTRKKSERSFILHNIGERELKRPDYIKEMCQYKTSCPKCKMLIQKVRSLIDETDNIKMDEVIGVCEHCKRSNPIKCRRCEYIVSQYLSLKNRDYQNKQARFVAWLIKLNNLLRDILDTESICKHKLYQESQSKLDLEQLFSQFKYPLGQIKPNITYFPTKEAEQLPYLSALEESKGMLDKILISIKSVKTPSNSYEDGSFLSSSRCVCKYFMSKNMEGRCSMEVLPQETYYPSGLINSREFVKSFRPSLKGSLDRERLAGKRLSITDHSKEREPRSFIAGGSQDFSDLKDEYGKKKISNREKYGREGGSKSHDYGEEKGSIMHDYGRKGKVDEDMSGKGGENNKEDTTKQESLIKHLPKKRRDITKGDKEGKMTKKEDNTKESKKKTDKEEGRNRKGAKVTSKIDNFTKEKQGKDNKDKEEDINKIGTKVTSKEDAKEKKEKDKPDKEEARNNIGTKVTSKKDDLTKEKKGMDNKDKKEDRNKIDIKVKKVVSKKDDFTKEKKEKDQTNKETKEVDEKLTKGGKKIEERKSEKKIEDTPETSKRKKMQADELCLIDRQIIKKLQKLKTETSKPVPNLSGTSFRTSTPVKKLSPTSFLPKIKRKTVIKTTQQIVPAVQPLKSESFIECNDYQEGQVKKVIIGNNTMRHFESRIKKDDSHEPILFKIMHSFPVAPPKIEKPQIKVSQTKPLDESDEMAREESAAGVINYQLSNPEWIEKGWTVLPTKKIVRKINIYKMEMVNPEFDFFKRNKSKEILFYDTGEKLAEIYSNETGKWFYKNGNLALDCYNPEEPNIKKRYIIYSSGDEKENGIFIPITILGLFDELGNAVIYDHFGNVRLKYNQTEGVVIDGRIGPQGRWKWHSLNDPPVLQTVLVDTYLQKRYEDLDDLIKGKEKSIPKMTSETNTEMAIIEFENFAKERKRKLLQKYKPFEIKMKALKINDYFSIKIRDQACVTITFRSSPELKLNLGMYLMHSEIVDTESADLSEIATPYDRIPAKTESVSNIQEALKRARNYGKSIRNREQCGSSVTRSGVLTRQSDMSTSTSI